MLPEDRNISATRTDAVPAPARCSAIDLSEVRSEDRKTGVSMCLSQFSIVARAIALSIFLVLLASCGDDGSNDKAKPSKVEQSQESLAVSVQPVSEQVTQTVGPEGGTLSTTDARGTRFVLEIPRDAIPGETVVTLTPADSIDGLPFKKGLVGAVQFGPEGLKLRQPALLTIEPARTVPVAEQLGFAYSGTGQDPHLAPMSLRSDIMQLQVLHFSGAGVGQGSPGDAAALKPVSPLARLQQEVAEAIQRERAQGSEELSGDAIKAIEDAMAEYQEYLDPLMKRAEKDCGLAHQIVPEQIALERQRQLLGLPSVTNGMSQVVAALDNCLDEATKELSKLCKEGASMEKLQAATARVLTYERERQLLGADENSSRSIAATETISQCRPKGWTGKITFSESQSTNYGGWEGSSRSQATITLADGTGRWEATESGNSTATNLTQGCAKKGSADYSGRGPAVLNLGGPGAANRGSSSSRPAKAEEKAAAVAVNLERDGSYSISFSLPLEGTSRIVSTGPSTRCEVGENLEEDFRSLGATVPGKGNPQPDRLAGTYTEPVEGNGGERIGERTVTWDLSRR